MTRSTQPTPGGATAGSPPHGLLLIGVAIVLTGLNLRTAVNSVGPVLEELEAGLGISSGAAGVVTTAPLVCFAALGFAGPPLSARFRDAHVLAGGLIAMAAGLVLRAMAGSLWLFLVGTVVAMTGGALGNVLLPSLVKRWFPTRTGLLVAAYSTALSVGGAVAALVPQQIVSRSGPDGWRWALGIWSVLAVVSALPWLFVPAQPGARTRRPAVPLRSLVRSPLAMALVVFFGFQAMQAYVIVGWVPQYLRDAGLSAATAGLLLAINTIITIPINFAVPVLAVRPRVQRRLLVVFLAGYVAGWAGMWAAPRAVPLLWMLLLAIGLGAFPFTLALIGLRARSAETTAALSTVTQSAGYLLAGLGPLLVGITRGLTGGYTGMFVVVLVGVVVLAWTGWLVTRQRYVDDELDRSVTEPPGDDGAEEAVECAGAEAPVAVQVREPDAGSPRG